MESWITWIIQVVAYGIICFLLKRELNQFDQRDKRLQERIVRFVTKNSGISEKKLLALMLAAEDMAADVGSILYGEEAVADGLIDRVGTLADAYEELYALIAEARAATKLRRKRAAQEK